MTREYVIRCELIRRDGPRLYVRGIDMLDATPILDIKPYVERLTGKAAAGWLGEAKACKDHQRGCKF